MMERLGWTLVQFLWQGALIAGAYAAVRRMTRASESRYLLACGAMAAMMLAPLGTFLYLGRGAAAPAVVATVTSAVDVAHPSGASWQSDSWTQVVPWLAVAWVVGVVVLLGRLAGGWWLTSRLRTRGARPVTAEWCELLQDVMARVGVVRPVQVLTSSGVDVPMVIGWLKPLILLPASALTGLPREHVAALLAHELAHIRRHDYLVNLVQSLGEALLFYHPAVWWVSAQMRAERELCCDDAAVAVGGDVLTYARALAGFEGLRPAHVRAAVTANGNSLRSRIRRLLHPAESASEMLPGAGAGWAVALTIAGVCAVAVMPAAPPQEAVVKREAIWVDTVKRGDMERAVRGLGKIVSASAAEIQIAESQAKDLKVGMAAKIDVMLAQPGKAVVLDKNDGQTKVIRIDQKVVPPAHALLAGTVQKVHPASGGTVTVDVQISGKAPDTVKSGQQCDALIVIERLKDVVYVGRPVFGKAESANMLFKVSSDGNSAVHTKVEFGRSSVNTIEVRSGLQVGDKVIVSDMKAYDGMDRVTLK